MKNKNGIRIEQTPKKPRKREPLQMSLNNKTYCKNEKGSIQHIQVPQFAPVLRAIKRAGWREVG